MLDGVAERRQLRIGGPRIAGRRRRPSGEKPPLPRQLNRSGVVWLIIGLVTLAVWIGLFTIPNNAEWWQDRDDAVVEWVAEVRSDIGVTLSKAAHALGSTWSFRPLRYAALLVLLFFRRWRHLLAGVVAFVGVDYLVGWISNEVARSRPLVPAGGTWTGYSHPSLPVASLAVTLTVIGFALFPAGKWRNRWMMITGTVVTALAASRVYLGVDHVSDGVVGGLFGAAAAAVVFKLFVPEAVFPVSYRRGVTAHLDVTGARGAAIRSALSDQLGYDVHTVEPHGLAGSGGSTPLRIELAGAPNRVIFGKLYAANHLRADRWYKLGRTLLYGSLEDEVRFSSVRRLVEYEDYMLLRTEQAGVPTTPPLGVVGITPEREYLLITGFLTDAVELGEAEITPDIIDQALGIVRRFWDIGMAHRDIKPSNLMVQEGSVRVIDVSFATLRPSPWREAVDLANMMLVLALRADPEVVYSIALDHFSPDDIAEAFAATHGVTIPNQLERQVKAHRQRTGIDLRRVFRDLAPPADVIHLQRVSLRRLAVIAASIAFAALVVGAALQNFRTGWL